MSQPKRYICTRVLGMFEMQHAENGDWVYHSDYAALAAEVERLKQPWVKILTESETWNALSEVARLTAENDRLRKAGDAVCESPYLLETDEAVIAWRAAAKEGRDAK